MTTKTRRRLIMLVFVLGGPAVGWALNGDRGLLLGAAVSLFAIVWFIVPGRKAL